METVQEKVLVMYVPIVRRVGERRRSTPSESPKRWSLIVFGYTGRALAGVCLVEKAFRLDEYWLGVPGFGALCGAALIDGVKIAGTGVC